MATFLQLSRGAQLRTLSETVDKETVYDTFINSLKPEEYPLVEMANAAKRGERSVPLGRAPVSMEFEDVTFRVNSGSGVTWAHW